MNSGLASYESPHKKPEGLHRLSTVELIQRAIRDSDIAALHEFHRRPTVYLQSSGEWFRLSEYLGFLRERELNRNGSQAARAHDEIDRAHDLTLDKFLSLPADASKEVAGGKGSVDCRHYFRAYLKGLERRLKASRHLNPLQEVSIAAGALAGFVWRHFQLSLREAKRRSNPFVCRYFWIVNGSKICITLPRHMSGRKKRDWLEANIDDPDPARPGERKRVQRIIDERLELGTFYSLDESSGQAALRVEGPIQRPVLFADSDSLSDLDRIVADEKSASLDRQRPSIRALGPHRLRGMILRIFDDLIHDRFRDSEIARDFGLSKASFSRFAGGRWDREAEGVVPDLWLNTAHVLSRFAPFVEAAREAGVWETARKISARRQAGN